MHALVTLSFHNRTTKGHASHISAILFTEKLGFKAYWIYRYLCFLYRMWQSVHTCQPSLSQPSFLPPEERGTKGGPGESPVCGQQGCGRVAGKVSKYTGLHVLALTPGGLNRNYLFCIRNHSFVIFCLHCIFKKTLLCPGRYWQTREQRAPTTTKVKPQGKARAEDQEQQDPMEFLQSDEENGEEEEAAEEEKGSQGGGAAKRRLQEQRERLHGALALIELANNLSAWTPTHSMILDTPFPAPHTSMPKPPSCSMCCS